MTLQTKVEEFHRNVWNHAEDEFQLGFDAKEPLSEDDVRMIVSVVEMFGSKKTSEEISAFLRGEITAKPERIEVILQLCGMTRNKILQDLKGYAAANRITLSLSKHTALHRDTQTWRHAGKYLVEKMRGVMSPLKAYPNKRPALESLNQATWPGFIRQERAKRSGHEAERRLAQLFKEMGIGFQPVEKSENPLCPDILINGVSFDVIVSSSKEFLLGFKCTVHTANIGQYGESKDHLEVKEAREMIDKEFTRSKPLLMALIDGVGFKSNTAGLYGVLTHADEFCQFKTIWKAAAVAAKVTGKRIKILLPAQALAEHSAFIGRYSCSRVSFNAITRVSEGGVQAGEAQIEQD